MRRLHSILYQVRVLLSFSVAFSLLAAMSLKVYVMWKEGTRLEKELSEIRNSPISFVPHSGLCDADSNGGLSRLEPDGASLMLGYSLNWEEQVPSEVNEKLGHRAAIFNAFIKVDGTMTPPFDNKMLAWFGQQVSKEGGVLALTVEVVSSLETLQDEVYDSLARSVTKINTIYGTPVLLRYCHEMNGDWTQYGYKPSIYIDSFRKMTLEIRKRTNMTAMLWSPNIGIAYPFKARPDSPSLPPSLLSDPYNQFRYLDTNNDNRLDSADDPYLPYYPGNEYVDWVGLSLYYYPSGTKNTVPSAKVFSDQLIGTGQTLNFVYDARANRLLRNFYDRFALGKATGEEKPLCIAESGAPYIATIGGASEIAIKRAWWEQTISKSTISMFPKMKAVINFEEKKADAGEAEKDWAYTYNAQVLREYVNFLDSGSRVAKILWGGKGIKFDCSGAVTSTNK